MSVILIDDRLLDVLVPPLAEMFDARVLQQERAERVLYASQLQLAQAAWFGMRS